ncbi:zinc finger protein [Macleaya cordata]|uniref:E3 ubiquitin-protein ligase RMA n=1 Tax=Macleaya cordata TaxID=56857 RepID=A0A200QRK7_MACCD|nr:zinc finger protein [Macleaya cordata]
MDNIERDDLTNFDLNLGSFGLLPTELEDLYYSDILRGHNPLDDVSPRPRNRWRRRRPVSTSHETRNFPLELLVNPSSGSERRSQVGEGSVGAGGTEETAAESSKTGKRIAVDLLGNGLDKDEDKEKSNDDEMSFFDCNICFDMANDPVLTFCGHLFCWPCLYQWLHVYSRTKLCPVCQAELTDANITPIYGRGNANDDKKMKSKLTVPPRPQARRVESFRQSIQRAVSSSFQIEEMIQRIGRRFDVTGNGTPPQDFGRSIELLDRADFLATQILASGRIRRDGYRRNLLLEQSLLETQDNVAGPEVEGSHLRPPPRPFLRSHSQRAASVTRLSSALSSDDRLLNSYILGQHMRRNHSHSSPIENRDSPSSVPPFIPSEIPRVDAAAEIDLMLPLPLSSSDTPRPSFLDSEVFRALRRRRMN